MPDTMNYMIAGYGIIFGVLFLYSLSLWKRHARVQKEHARLADGVKGEKPNQG